MATKKQCNKCFPIPAVVRGDCWLVVDGGRDVGAYYWPDVACGVAKCQLKPGHRGDHEGRIDTRLVWPDTASVKEKDWIK
jgi:hypothetical protein